MTLLRSPLLSELLQSRSSGYTVMDRAPWGAAPHELGPLILLCILGLAMTLGFLLAGLGANATDFQLQLSPGMLV
jgi:hypothetical protein